MNVSELKEKISQSDLDQKREIALELEKIGSDEAIDVLFELLRDSNRGVVDRALDCLIRLGNKKVFDSFINITNQKQHESPLFTLAYDGLCQISHKRIADIIEISQKSDGYTKKICIDIVSNNVNTKGKEALAISKKLIRDNDPNVRMGTVELLGKKVGLDANEILTTMYDMEQDEWVRFSIVESLLSLNGPDFKIGEKTLKELSGE
ncbi:MAG: HEAT repeat domain-containing protein [Leptospiraceae bacterium]|nr:HEAT repeat domain-containing protein [Leptospiraceae bacterium]MCP5492995.1 HEAT repeat domain-containing protein [Leptospiraceae bacterium]